MEPLKSRVKRALPSSGVLGRCLKAFPRRATMLNKTLLGSGSQSKFSDHEDDRLSGVNSGLRHWNIRRDTCNPRRFTKMIGRPNFLRLIASALIAWSFRFFGEDSHPLGDALMLLGRLALVRLFAPKWNGYVLENLASFGQLGYSSNSSTTTATFCQMGT
ncbi:hypothetical protein KY285_030346 [Solanum tuberosum]|nr:hypothetical protein KY285_030346 [Solanum tuberosum]